MSLRSEKIDYDVLFTVLVLTQIFPSPHIVPKMHEQDDFPPTYLKLRGQKRRVCRFDREELLSCAKLIRICAEEKRGRRVSGGIHGTLEHRASYMLTPL